MRITKLASDTVSSSVILAKSLPATALALLLALLAQPPSMMAASGPATPEHPNVVFILADDLGWADTTLYGHTTFYKTPNLERLAKRGMTFTHAYSASPLCSPTRSSIMTGLNPARTGITTPNCHIAQIALEAKPGVRAAPSQKSIAPIPASRLKTEYFTLAEALKAAGYATGHFGKWHLGAEPYSPLQQGFDVDVPHWPGPGPAGSYVAPWKFPDFDPDTPNEHIEDRMAREAVAFMEKHKDAPFFLNYWMFSVHAPFDAKQALIDKYRKLADPANPQHSPTYAAMIESMDDAVGTLLDTIDRLDLAKRTIIVFFSDNGGNMYNTIDDTTPTSNTPLRGGKATLYEGGVRVPCVVCWPGTVTGSTRSDSVVQSCDFYPTLLDMLGLSARPGQSFDGISITPALKGRPLERQAIFTYFPHDPHVPDWLPPAVTVHSGDWKLIRIFYGGENGAHRWKLFNLRDDLGERNDVAAAHPERVQAMDKLISTFLENTAAVTPIANPAFDPAKYHPEDEGKAAPRHERTTPKAAVPEKDDPRLLGWKARGCAYDVKDGILTVNGNGETPFLGYPAGRFHGPARLELRARSLSGGRGKIEWLDPRHTEDAKSVPFALPAGEWQQLGIDVPAEGPMPILRVYLPAIQQAVDVDWLELTAGTQKQRWDFGTPPTHAK